MPLAEDYNMRCPSCGQDEELSVSIQAWASLTSEGTDPTSAHYFDDDDLCHCPTCEYAGIVRDFKIEDKEQKSA